MICMIEDCDRLTSSRGMCGSHYDRWRKNPDDVEALHAPIGAYRRNAGCTVDGCENPHDAIGLCGKHRVRLYRTGTTEKLPRKPKAKPEPKPCTVEGCEKDTKTIGLCSMHYTRQRRHGTLEGPEAWRPDPILRFGEHVTTKGDCWEWTGKRDKDEYGIFSVDGKTVRAHRWLWRRLVNPDLTAQDQLDHICGNPPCVRPGHIQQSDGSTHAGLTRYRTRRLKANPGKVFVPDHRHRNLQELFFGLQNGLPTALNPRLYVESTGD